MHINTPFKPINYSVKIKRVVFWDVWFYCMDERYRFAETCCLLLHARRLKQQLHEFKSQNKLIYTL
jgi:hypothetical protein